MVTMKYAMETLREWEGKGWGARVYDHWGNWRRTITYDGKTDKFIVVETGKDFVPELGEDCSHRWGMVRLELYSFESGHDPWREKRGTSSSSSSLPKIEK